ncbi:MAG TPA: polysaccharide biosynthesis/export family protein [Deltaproteobacteria bacterium]|jgi:polysaccharide export outer membrane protein|nr:polysaccharide biosynthesis/export family protein [Deltaproteobacteria bacterium]HOI07663.1 polysaccharide biosynthesis/export family protein [Deltaproteobacteria bacterium]
MKKIVFAMLGVLIPMVLFASEASYTIGPSDQLEISVWGEENLSRQVVVRSDGFISLPLVGDLLAEGKTPPQLQREIETILAKYIKQPHAAVIIREPRSKRFYVQGQVNQPGEYILDKAMTITQVITRAGGFNQWADTGGVVVLRNQKEGQVRLPVNYNKIIKGAHENILIQPGDTVIVP